MNETAFTVLGCLIMVGVIGMGVAVLKLWHNITRYSVQSNLSSSRRKGWTRWLFSYYRQKESDNPHVKKWATVYFRSAWLALSAFVILIMWMFVSAIAAANAGVE